VMLWYYRSSISDADILGILVAVSLLFGFTHSYDIAALTPLVPAFWRHVHGSPTGSVWALGLMLVITVPNSTFEPFHLPLLAQARVVALCAALTWLLAMSIRHAAASEHVCTNRHMRPHGV
jgi:hypothetical protein